MSDVQHERRKDDPRVRKLIADMGSLMADVGALSSEVAANTVLTKQIQESTAGLVEFFNDSREAFRLFNKLMSAVRWFLRKALFPIVVIVAVLYAVAHDMRPPGWLKYWVELFK